MLKTFLPHVSLLPEQLHAWKQPGEFISPQPEPRGANYPCPWPCPHLWAGSGRRGCPCARARGSAASPQHPGNSQQEKPAAASCRSVCFDCLLFYFIIIFFLPGCCSLPFCQGDSLPGARRQLERAQGNHGASAAVGYLSPFSGCPSEGGTLRRGGAAAAWGKHHARLGTAVG